MNQQDYILFIDPVKTAKSLGIPIYPLNVLHEIANHPNAPDPSEIMSVTTQYNGKPVIFVNTDYPQAIVRWFIAKELKHIIELCKKRNDNECSLNKCKLCAS